MIKNLLFSLLILIPAGVFSQSKNLVLNPRPQMHSAEIVSEKQHEIKLQINLNQLVLNQVDTDYGKPYIVSTKDAPQMLKAGVPDIFYLPQSVIIPNTGTMEIEIIPGNFKEYEGIEVAPSKGNLLRNVNPNDVPYKKGEVFNQNKFFPGSLATMREPYILRDFRAQTIDVFPVQYNPVTKTLRVYEEITVVMNHSSKKGINELANSNPNRIFDSEFSKIYSRMFLNHNPSKYTPLEEEGDLLIICHDAFMEAMKPFINWKRTIGRKVEMVSKTQAGTTSSAIKSFIADYYNSSENNLAYVLLVGDAAQIPTNAISSGDSDNAYGYIAGNDSYSEVFIGRFSAETVAHVETQVKRMIEYERDLNSTDTWLKNGLGVARNEGQGNGHNGEADYQHIDLIRDTLLNYTYTEVYREYDGGVPGLTNTTSSVISSRINSGVSIINYCNHGSETGWSVAGYNSNHVNALTNTRKLPFIWAVACVNGAFVNTTCFAETWLRATHQGEPSGAIGTFMSTINQDWQPPMTGQDEMVTILSESFDNNIKRTFGGLSLNGSMKMLDVHGSSGRETHDTWTLFGDPTLLVRTDTPQDMVVSHLPTIFIGSTTLNVTCDTDGALVAISYTDQEGDVILLASALVVDGNASIEFTEPINQPLDLVVAVTAYNKTTYLGEISSVPADRPYVVLSSFSTSGSPDFGKEIDINITLKNVSETPYTATSTQVKISTTSTYVTIQEDTFDAGSIDPDESIGFDNAFTISIADDVPDQEKLIFTLDFSYTYDGEAYESSQVFIIRANAPVITINNITIDDGGEGIPGILDPGETADAKISISNTGHADAPDVLVSISSISSYLTINNNEPFSLGSISVGSSKEAIFSFTADSETPLETPVKIDVIASSNSYEASKQLVIIVGYIPEYNIGDSPVVTACIGKFFDTGGSNNPYSNDENKVITFKPASENSALIFNFSDFDVEEGYDYLYIYNGESASAAQIYGSPFTGNNSPGQFMATSESGAITFRFVSDSYVDANGWAAEFSCVDLSVAPTCASNPYPEIGGMATLSPLKLTWDFVPGAILYDVFFAKEELPSEPTASVPTNYFTVEIDPETDYIWKVVPKNNAGEPTSCPTWTFYTEELTEVVLMHNGSITTCNSILYDTGGNDSNYQNSENLKLTIHPSDSWAKVVLSFLQFQIEDSYDYLKIYNGTTSLTSNLIGIYTGTNQPPTIISTHSTGALTIHFTSDPYVHDKGWAALIGCETVTQPVTFEVKTGSGLPIEGAKISTSLEELTTNSEGIATHDFPQNCVFDFELSKDGFSLQEGNFFVAQEPKTISFVMYPVSTETNGFEDISIYPNPFSGTITLSGFTGSTKGSLFTALGQSVMNFEFTGSQTETINTQNLHKGVYMLLLTNDKGEIAVRKLVKE